MNSYSYGTLGLDPLGVSWLEESGSYLAACQLWPADWDLGMPCKGKWITVSCLQALGAPGCQATLFLAPRLREAVNACSTQAHLSSLRGFWLGHVSCGGCQATRSPFTALTLRPHPVLFPLASHRGEHLPLYECCPRPVELSQSWELYLPLKPCHPSLVCEHFRVCWGTILFGLVV